MYHFIYPFHTIIVVLGIVQWVRKVFWREGLRILVVAVEVLLVHDGKFLHLFKELGWDGSRGSWFIIQVEIVDPLGERLLVQMVWVARSLCLSSISTK